MSFANCVELNESLPDLNRNKRSDLDLFLIGLNEEQARRKVFAIIEQVGSKMPDTEQSSKPLVLRTKHSVTIDCNPSVQVRSPLML